MHMCRVTASWLSFCLDLWSAPYLQGLHASRCGKFSGCFFVYTTVCAFGHSPLCLNLQPVTAEGAVDFTRGQTKTWAPCEAPCPLCSTRWSPLCLPPPLAPLMPLFVYGVQETALEHAKLPH
eukprot:1160000-Pelagomonas_calceolata.AAC.13